MFAIVRATATECIATDHGRSVWFTYRFNPARGCARSRSIVNGPKISFVSKQ
jgi:hypothetical protein